MPAMLRIARHVASVVLLALCVALVALWVRSYDRFVWWGPGLTLTPAGNGDCFVAKSGFLFESARGVIVLEYVGNLAECQWWNWSCGSGPAFSELRVTGDDEESASN